MALRRSFCLMRASVGKIFEVTVKVGRGEGAKSAILSSAKACIAEAWHLAVACFLHSVWSGCRPYQSKVCSGIGTWHLHRHWLLIVSVAARFMYDPDGFSFVWSNLIPSEQNLILRWCAAQLCKRSCICEIFHRNPGGPNITNGRFMACILVIQSITRCQCDSDFCVGILAYQFSGLTIHRRWKSPRKILPVYSVPLEVISSIWEIRSQLNVGRRASSVILESSTIRTLAVEARVTAALGTEGMARLAAALFLLFGARVSAAAI